MLNFTVDDEKTKAIAHHYCQILKNPLADAFFSGQSSPSTKSEALEIANAFWEITELASQDHLNEIEILENIDIEFWMHKLFNKTHGYFQKNGFSEEWKKAENENS